MKKVSFGTRPSELKGRDKKIDFHDEGIEGLRKAIRSDKKPPKSRVNIKVIVIVFACAALFAGVYFYGLSSDMSLVRVEFVSGEKLHTVKDSESFKINYADGLVLKRVVLSGFYRLFPPDDIIFRIGEVERPAKNSEDMAAFLEPEKKISYEILFSRKSEDIGKLFFSLEMDAKGWVQRAEKTEDLKVRKICFKKAVELDPDSEDAHIALGRLFESEEKLKEASAEFEVVVKLNPKNVTVLKALVELYKKRGIKKKLVNIYEKLGDADPSQADKYYYQGGILAEQVISSSSALNLYRKALEVDKNHIDARQKLIKIYEREKQWNRAVANTKVLIELDPKNHDLYLYLSDLYLKLKDSKKAAEAAKTAEKLKPGSAAICLQLAQIYEKGKDYKNAVKYYEKSIKYYRKNDGAYNALGLLLEKQGKVKFAIKNYKKAVDLKPRNKVYLMNLADAYEKDGSWTSAVKTYEKIVKIDKKNKTAWEAIASLSYEKLKSKWKAVEAYLALSKIEPKKISWYQKSADLYEQLGKFSRAKKQYEAILKIDPKNKKARKRYVELSKMKAISGSK
jgi:tetratricopeptide (TPR) repeat protein